MSNQSFDINSPVDSTLTTSGYSNNALIVNSTSDRSTNKKNNLDDESDDFGWFKFQPKFLMHFMNARWALFWLCWGGALQGISYNKIIIFVLNLFIHFIYVYFQTLNKYKHS